METHFDSSGDLAESLLFHVEAHGIVMVAFSLWFHGISTGDKISEYKSYFGKLNLVNKNESIYDLFAVIFVGIDIIFWVADYHILIG